MFERINERVRLRAEQRARKACADIRDRLDAQLPRGIDAKVADGGVLLSGRGLVRRSVIDPALRRLIVGGVR